jgi:hypothetical protein
MMVGAAIATVLSIYQDRILARYLASSAKNFENASRFRRVIDLTSPEARLYFACVESALLPIGLFWFGVSQTTLYIISHRLLTFHSGHPSPLYHGSCQRSQSDAQQWEYTPSTSLPSIILRTPIIATLAQPSLPNLFVEIC